MAAQQSMHLFRGSLESASKTHDCKDSCACCYSCYWKQTSVCVCVVITTSVVGDKLVCVLITTVLSYYQYFCHCYHHYHHFNRIERVARVHSSETKALGGFGLKPQAM